MLNLEIQTKKFADFEEIQDLSPDDVFLVHDGRGVKKVKASQLNIGKGDDNNNNNDLLALLGEGAGPHNSIYRGKFLGGVVTPEQRAEIQSGKFNDLYIGDFWIINGITWRIAAFDYYFGCGDTEANLLRSHHVTIVPDTTVGANQQMNGTNVTTGAYVGSAMRGNAGAAIAAGHLNAVRTIINAAFPGMVLRHRNYLNNAVTTGRVSGGLWADSDIELMNETMVYGCKQFAPGEDGTNLVLDHVISKSQLPLFQYRHDLIRAQNTPWISYWLRDVVTASFFALVYFDGSATYGTASASLGVRPAFSIS